MDYFKFNANEEIALQRVAQRRNAMLGKHATSYDNATRRFGSTNSGDNFIRNPYVTDIERILNNPLYNRYADKTQVFSFYKNDDVTRRALHVQLVSRIARNIGNALELNIDLIEAIALGHDIGHTPFGHEGERILGRLYMKNGKMFNHNVHSVRILDEITNTGREHGLTLQTLDGILCHNGEKVHEIYEPYKLSGFDEFDERLQRCYYSAETLKSLRPSTLEGCVVRISDIIAYLGKDRIDLIHTKQNHLYSELQDNLILGKKNKEIVQRLTQNVIKNSMNKSYIGLDKEVYEALELLKNDNYNIIYCPHGNEKVGMDIVSTMAEKLFDKFIKDIESYNKKSSIFVHYLDNMLLGWSYFEDKSRVQFRAGIDSSDIVIDYMASMTDDYFIDIYQHYFGIDKLSESIKYIQYTVDLE